MRLTELAYFKIAAIFSWLVPGFLEFLDPRRIELAQGAGRPHGSSTRSACASMGLGDSRRTHDCEPLRIGKNAAANDLGQRSPYPPPGTAGGRSSLLSRVLTLSRSKMCWLAMPG